MESKVEHPKFANEAEEAQWWFENHERLTPVFEQASREGKLRFRRDGIRSASEGHVVLALDEADIEKAKERAAAHGLTEFAYLSQVLHTALAQDDVLMERPEISV